MDSAAIQGKGPFPVDRGEALRYLGYAGQAIDDALVQRIEEACERCERVSQAGWVYRVFPVRKEGGSVILEGSTLALEGESIREHLRGARSCAVMAATCGMANERELRRLQSMGGLEALVFDAAGSALAEAAADACNAAIVARAHEAGLHTNYRFGPGYGDLSLSVQAELVRVLGADRRLGVSVGESGLLIPVKSVTAFVGLFDVPQETQRSCARCGFLPYCTLRERKQRCYQ